MLKLKMLLNVLHGDLPQNVGSDQFITLVNYDTNEDIQQLITFDEIDEKYHNCEVVSVISACDIEDEFAVLHGETFIVIFIKL